MSIKLIVGLANWNVKYTETRHNAGSWYVKLLAKHYRQKLREEHKLHSYISNLTIGNRNVHLLVPMSFMNLSGKAIAAVSSFYNILPIEILIAHDELDLLPGKVRLKLGGSSGHKGLKSVIKHLDNNSNFYRLRIGIGRPSDKEEITSFVLSKPNKIEFQLINDAIKKAIYYTNILISQDVEKAMNHLHT